MSGPQERPGVADGPADELRTGGQVPAGAAEEPRTGGEVPAGQAEEPRTGGDGPAGAADAPRTGAEGPAGPGQRRSGLRNPERAVRGLGAGTLALEALVLLLAIQPIRLVGGHLGGAAIGAIVALAVACVLLAGQMKRPWAWPVGTVLQGLLMLSGLLHWSLLVLGVMFALVWGYALHVRRVILG